MSATAEPPLPAVADRDGLREAAAASGPAECPAHAAAERHDPGRPATEGGRPGRLSTSAADRAAAAALTEVSTGQAPPLAPPERPALASALRVAPARPGADALPPGPAGSTLGQTLAWIRDPAGFMDRCFAEYGPTFTVRIGPGADVVFLADPNDVGEVFRGSPDLMHMGDVNGLFRRVLGRESLLVIDGERHMRGRRLLLPPFGGKRIADQEPVMVAAAEETVARWPAGKPFALQPHMQTITLDVILRAVFGLRDGPRRDRLRALLTRLLELSNTMAMTLPPLRRELFGLSPWGRLMRCTRDCDEALYAEIHRRRAEGGDRGDVLSLLLAAHDEDGEPMSDREIRDQLLTLLVAGHETTATALAWAFERLLREPHALAKTRAGLAAGSFAYLDAVVKEALRLRPTLPIAARKLTGEATIGERTYPAGTVLMPCIHLVHRNPVVWEDPTAFRPERFLEAPAPPSYAWIPFGGGVRRCLGAGFALAEMRAVMRVVLERMDLEPVGVGERIVRRSFTLSPEHGARVIARPRSA